MDSEERQLQFAFRNDEVGTRYYILIKNIVEELIKSADDQRVRKRLSIRAMVDPITDFVDQDPDINGGRIKSILDSDDYSKPFITDFCMHLSTGPIKKRSEINDDFQIIVSHYLLLVAPPAPPAPAPPAPAPPAPQQQDAGHAEGVAVFNNEFKGGKRRSIKKRRKSMSKRRKNRRKSNKKQRRR
jgi:hypothetical protein